MSEDLQVALQVSPKKTRGVSLMIGPYFTSPQMNALTGFTSVTGLPYVKTLPETTRASVLMAIIRNGRIV